MNMKLIGISATQPNTGAAGAASTGDSLTIENGKGRISAIAIWAKNQVAGAFQLAFPSGHDTTRGLRASVPIGFNIGILPIGMMLDLQAQETLAPLIIGSNVAGDVEQAFLLMHYADLPGISQRLMTTATVHSRMEKLTAFEATIAAAVGPGYTVEELINADSDLMLANRDYAVLGATSRTAVGAITIRGPDLGNVRIGVPGDIANPQFTAGFFLNLSNATGLPCVPVINSGNRASTWIGVHNDENNGNIITTWYLALLK
jgi:hypothetical protein